MKLFEFEVNESPATEFVNDKGEYVFGIYASNACGQELEQAIETIASLWRQPVITSEVTLMINIRLLSVYEMLYEMYNADGKINKEYKHLFDALKNDCQSIVNQINSLEVIHD